MFTKAVRRKVKLKIALTGPSGSGKTLGALKIATGIGGKIAVIDCENDSASLYADKFEFDSMNMTPPFTTEKYLQAIDAAQKAGYDVLIIDTISHAWAGTGGLMEQKDKLDSSGKGSGYTNWGPITKKHEAFKSGFLQTNMHVICNMRSKQDYILVEDKGKQVPKKVGMAPIQRDGMEYEFTTVFDINMNNEAEVSKDRTGMFKETFQITEETGKMFINWLNEASHEALPPPPPEKKDPPKQAEKKQEPFKVYEIPPQPLTALEKIELGKFVIPGGPYKGKKLGDVSYDDIMFYKNEKVTEAQIANALMHPVIQDLVNRIDTYYMDFKPT